MLRTTTKKLIDPEACSQQNLSYHGNFTITMGVQPVAEERGIRLGQIVKTAWALR
jgi:hypothetical protein